MFREELHKIASGDVFEDAKKDNLFVGRPFYLDYDKAQILVADAWKNRVNGIPQGSFLLAFYEGEEGIEEAVLLRALKPSRLPSDNDIVSTMIEYYKEGTPTQGRAGSESESKLDDFTRYEFSFSGLECRVLGTYYRTKNSRGEDITEFGADLENFYSANNYKVYKATGNVLSKIVNQREGDNIAGGENESPIGTVRFSSSRRFQNLDSNVEVFISPKDFIGKRTALFGMTRTGKSNTVKKIIEATEDISNKAPFMLADVSTSNEPFTQEGKPTFPVGQIIFDVNGEYANANLQDDGTAIFELFRNKVTRYSVMDKEGFEVLKVNFYKEIHTGFTLIKNYFSSNKVTGVYIENFMAVSLDEPEVTGNSSLDFSNKSRYSRIKAAYLCCLYKAKFKIDSNLKVYFEGNKNLNSFKVTRKDKNGNEKVENFVSKDPKNGLTLEEATAWFSNVWKYYDEIDYINNYPNTHDGREWADDDLKALLAFLTTYKKPNEKEAVAGYGRLRTNELLNLHTPKNSGSFEIAIPELLRQGKIVIVDLSQGAPIVQKLFSERICRSVFDDSMTNFVNNNSNNFIQFYFEEAHNLFPKKEEKDLTDIYNRIAKEGAKLNIGMTYATQEVSSISANILKNTQNWFIAHLNNDDEMKELRKYYDFSDFTDSLIKFSSNNDKGFVRMKTYTNPFVVPVQIDRFLANREVD